MEFAGLNVIMVGGASGIGAGPSPPLRCSGNRFLS